MQTMSGFSRPLDAQDDDPHAGIDLLPQFGKVSVQFRRRPEKQLAFKVQNDHAVAARIVRLAITEEPIAADGQFAGRDPGGAGTNMTIDRATPIKMESSTLTKTAARAVTNTRPAS